MPTNDDVDLKEPNTTPAKTTQEELREKVLSTDPRAQFVVHNGDDNKSYTGPVAATLEDRENESDTGFAQHIGRSIYALHPVNPPKNHQQSNVEVRYKNEQAIATLTKQIEKDVGDWRRIHDKGLLGNGLPNQNTGSGDSKINNDASSKAISQTGEGYALDTIAPEFKLQ